MDIYTAGIFILALLITVYLYDYPKFKVFGWLCLGGVWFYFAGKYLYFDHVHLALNFAVPFLFGAVVGTAIGAFSKTREEFFREQLSDDYIALLKGLPDFTEIEIADGASSLFFITEGDFAAHAFLITKCKDRAEYVYADVLDDPMENLPLTPESHKLGEQLATMVMMREDLGYEA